MPDETGSPTNFWQFLLICFDWIGGRATRILALTQGTIAIIATQDKVLTQNQAAWAVLSVAILTFWRGQTTAKVYANAQAIVKQASSPDVVLPDPLPSEPKKP